jgi:hypothetical protein
VATAGTPTSLSWILFLVAVAAGFVMGYVVGGRAGRLRVPSGLIVGAVAAFGIQLGLAWLPEGTFGAHARIALLIATYCVVLIPLGFMVAASLRSRLGALGMAALVLVLSGWALNTAPIAVNGGMPVSRSALTAAGYPIHEKASQLERSWKHVLATRRTRLASLGDTVAVRSLRAVYSIGDFLLLAGITTLIAAGMRGEFDPRGERRLSPSTDPAQA